MKPRNGILAVAVAVCPLSAHADSIAGSWRIQTSDIGARRGCTLEGSITLKDTKPAMACEMVLVQQCVAEKGKHLIVREPCAVKQNGPKVEIKGTSYEIIEAVPRGEWSRQYKLDRFELNLQPDGATMKGVFKGYAHARATFTRMEDLAE